jgi:murein DD-endopeptidase MepM/ murein hydrolase activator NlpD
MLKKQSAIFYLFLFCVSFSFSQSGENERVDGVHIPADTLYQHTWNGANTVVRSGMFEKKMTLSLPLNLQGETAFVFPCVNKPKVCSPYGMRGGKMHSGTDIKQNLGDSIVAVWDGVVRMASKNYYGYGGIIVIRHANGLESVYAHLSKLEVIENQTVKAGDLIGKAGRTGRATTEHLHFEIRYLYTHFNPKTIIDFEHHKLCADTLFVKNGKFYGKESDNLQEEEDADAEQDAENNENSDLLAIVEELQPSYHTVQKGDTLYSLSNRYKISIQEICRLNNIAETNTLSIGQKLKIKK